VAKDPDFDEAALGFRKFSRFLRQAHDEEVINLERTDEGNYKISAVTTGDAVGKTAQSEASASQESGEDRGRGRGRRDRGERSAGRRGRESPASSRDKDEAAVSADTGETQEREEAVADVEPPVESKRETSAEVAAPPREAHGETRAPEAAPTRLAGRRRRAPRPKQTGPSVVPGPVDSVDTPAEVVVAEEKKDAAAPAPRPTTRSMGRFRRGSRGSGTPAAANKRETPAASVVESRPAAHEGAAPAEPQTDAVRAPQAEPETGAAGDLTGDQADMVERMARGYQGVGRRTAERLVEEFGDRVLEVIDNEPRRIEAVLPSGRAQAVIDGRRAEREAIDG